MPADTIQVNYEELERLCQRFAKCAQQAHILSSQVNQKVCRLREGGWSGRGANAFYTEMDDTVFPVMRGLQDALCEANTCACRCSEVYSQAEQEAAALFKDGAGGGGVGVGGVGGGGGGAVPVLNPDLPKVKVEGWGPYKVITTDRKMETGWYRLPDKNWLSKLWPIKTRDNILFQNEKFSMKNLENFQIKIPAASYRQYGIDRQKTHSLGGISYMGERMTFEAGTFDIGGQVHLSKGAGLFVEGTASKLAYENAFGNRMFAITNRYEIKGPSAGGYFGINENHKGAYVGASLISAEYGQGLNIAGYNVGVVVGAGIKKEYGFVWGDKGVKVKLPLVTVGLDFGKAIGYSEE